MTKDWVTKLLYRNRTFSDEQITIDGNEYVGCRFIRVRFVFYGSSGMRMSGNSMIDCEWGFGGAAELTLRWLKEMHAAGGGTQALVEATLDDIRLGSSMEASNEPIVTHPTIFIGHGGRSLAYLELEHFLKARDLQVEMFESDPRAGTTAVGVVEEMADRANMAFIIHTAEDEGSDNAGPSRARQNVVHETGLFQGRLGLNRAIVVREAGCEPFSNLAGVQEIRFEKETIRSAFPDVLKTVQREFPGSVA